MLLQTVIEHVKEWEEAQQAETETIQTGNESGLFDNEQVKRGCVCVCACVLCVRECLC